MQNNEFEKFFNIFNKFFTNSVKKVHEKTAEPEAFFRFAPQERKKSNYTNFENAVEDAVERLAHIFAFEMAARSVFEVGMKFDSSAGNLTLANHETFHFHHLLHLISDKTGLCYKVLLDENFVQIEDTGVKLYINSRNMKQRYDRHFVRFEERKKEWVDRINYNLCTKNLIESVNKYGINIQDEVLDYGAGVRRRLAEELEHEKSKKDAKAKEVNASSKEVNASSKEVNASSIDWKNQNLESPQPKTDKVGDTVKLKIGVNSVNGIITHVAVTGITVAVPNTAWDDGKGFFFLHGYKTAHGQPNVYRVD